MKDSGAEHVESSTGIMIASNEKSLENARVFVHKELILGDTA